MSPFSPVRWSTEHARTDTVANLRGRSLAFAGELTDIDEVADWRAASRQRGRLVLPAY
jgi:hypothetical protein